MGKSDYATASISTHRSYTTVTVVVYHLEVIAVLSRFKGHEAVSTYAETAMAYHGNFLLAKLPTLFAIVNNHKVVTGTIELVEFHISQ